ncbi:hypothetical protein BAE44_0025536 [Dichanthelium oligosanthes]|uniref:Uncharacterized protein n=1 Tax=Dichanthelium oligosanthes TaxID=888268 RepID=A0A1E5UKP5_9POAL|nr:hypothetical protein BAE44_0025536 [Dichanthelium oligosanthes]
MEVDDEVERKGRKRVRGRGAVALSSQKEDPTTPAAQERRARLVAEAIEAWEKRAAEAKGKPELDYYALQASQFPDDWNRRWSGYFGSFDHTNEPPHSSYSIHQDFASVHALSSAVVSPLTKFTFASTTVFPSKVYTIATRIDLDRYIVCIGLLHLLLIQ